MAKKDGATLVPYCGAAYRGRSAPVFGRRRANFRMQPAAIAVVADGMR